MEPGPFDGTLKSGQLLLCSGAQALNARRSCPRRQPENSEVSVFEIGEILDLAIRLERNGEAEYRAAMRRVSDPRLLEMLEWMAEEEVRHRRWFENLKQTLDTGGGNPFLKEMGRSLFGDTVGSQSFSLREVDFAAIETAAELLEVFGEFENDTVVFYEMIEPFVEDGPTRGQLREIIEEEKRHIDQIRALARRGLEFTLAGGPGGH